MSTWSKVLSQWSGAETCLLRLNKLPKQGFCAQLQRTLMRLVEYQQVSV